MACEKKTSYVVVSGTDFNGAGRLAYEELFNRWTLVLGLFALITLFLREKPDLASTARRLRTGYHQ